MIVIGARGFAKHCLEVLYKKGEVDDNLVFYDDLNNDTPDLLFNKFKVLRNIKSLEEYLQTINADYILGVGGPIIRKTLVEKIDHLGGFLRSLISQDSIIGTFGVELGIGLNIMENVLISSEVKVGKGTLINLHASLSHDVKVGQYCEIAPGARLLGRSVVGDLTHIGSNAVILPDIHIGSNVKVGAGAVVTKDVPDNMVVAGVPAREIKKIY